MNPHPQTGQYVEKRFRAAADEIEVKEDGDGRKRARLPISSTALDRDGDEFSHDGLEHERDQINEGRIPAFLDHGRGSRGGWYGALGIVGTWDDADIATASYDDEEVDVLYADFVPTEANEDAADIVALLEDDMPVGASVGFRIVDYEHDRDEGTFTFNAVDLLEVSIVGIPSNPLTVNDGTDTAIAKALGSPSYPYPVGVPRGYADQRLAGAPSLAGSYPLQAGVAGTAVDDSDAVDMQTIDETVTDMADGLDDLRRTIDDLSTDSPGPEPESDSSSDSSADSNSNLDSDLDSDLDSIPETTMSNTADDGGDDPATDDPNPTPGTGVAELRDDVSDLTETVGELADTTHALVDAIDEERSTDPEDDIDSEPSETDRRSLTVYLDEEADEDARKEFEALREKATGDGEIDLGESKTALLGSDDPDAGDDAATNTSTDAGSGTDESEGLI